MFAIRDMQAAGRIFMWVKKEPTFLPKEEYVEIDDDIYESVKNLTFWVDNNGKIVTKKPYTYKYHVLIDGEWKLDHKKEKEFISHIKNVYKNNISVYSNMGYEEERCNYLNAQISQIETLDDMEEFALISIGGKYASIYSKRYSVAL